MLSEISSLPVLAVLPLFIGIGFVFKCLVGHSQTSSEPPEIHSSVPYIGHVLGILRHRGQYVLNLWYGLEFRHLHIP